MAAPCASGAPRPASAPDSGAMRPMVIGPEETPELPDPDDPDDPELLPQAARAKVATAATPIISDRPYGHLRPNPVRALPDIIDGSLTL